MRLRTKGAARVREVRKRLGLTQQAMADQLGIDRSYVARMERGHTTPRPTMWLALETLLWRGWWETTGLKDKPPRLD